ncbi:winged helix-turn-helix domain-containing protein [Halopiger thermotolerans]
MTTIYQDIQDYLRSNGRSTTGEMSDALGFSTRQVRQACKDLKDDGKINGSKSKVIPAYIINGEYVVITESRNQLLQLVKDHAPSHHSRAKGMSTEQLQKLIRNQVADQVVGGPKIWEFWK